MPSPALPVVRERIRQQWHMCAVSVCIGFKVITPSVPRNPLRKGVAAVPTVTPKVNGLNTGSFPYTLDAPTLGGGSIHGGTGSDTTG
jgi:hypothetical protein